MMTQTQTLLVIKVLKVGADQATAWPVCQLSVIQKIKGVYFCSIAVLSKTDARTEDSIAHM